MFRFPDPLYAIADADASADVVGLAADILGGGATVLQLRAKQATTREFVALARRVATLTRRAGARLIINDRTDVARLVGADGVHLGQDDLPPAAARVVLGPAGLIGFSTHSLEQLDAAIQTGGADYLAFGPVFETRSKSAPDPTVGLATFAAARARCPLPLVAIGGISLGRAAAVRAAGADAVAVIGAIAHAANPGAATRALRDAVR